MIYRYKLTGWFVIIITICLICSCKKSKPPSIRTKPVVDVSHGFAVSGGTLKDEGSSRLLIMGLSWDTIPKPTVKSKLTFFAPLDEPTFTCVLTNLAPDRRYYVRAFAGNTHGITYGNEITFTTNPAETAALTTDVITILSSSSARSGGIIISENGGPVTARGVCWGTTPNPTVENSKTVDGTGGGSFASVMTGLNPNTKYFVRAYATNSAGTSYGNILSFITPFDVLLTKENSILTGGSVISASDGGNIIFAYIYKNRPNSSGILWLPYIIKLDSEGNRIWETEVSMDYFIPGNHVGLIETTNRNIVISYKSYVVMLDENGNILWKYEYRTDERYGCTSVIESDDHNLMVLAADDHSTSLLKISMSGDLLWERVIKDERPMKVYIGHLLRRQVNGNYLIAGHGGSDFWMAEVSPTGEIVHDYIHSDQYVLSRSNSMIKTNDGGTVLTGFSMGRGDVTHARILKFDSQNLLTWERSYTWHYFSNRIRSIIQDDNGDLVFCGTQGYQQVRAVLGKLDKDGNNLWKREYWPQNSVDFRWTLTSLQQRLDGGYILVGTKSKLWGQSMPEGVWVKKVDQNGN